MTDKTLISLIFISLSYIFYLFLFVILVKRKKEIIQDYKKAYIAL